MHSTFATGLLVLLKVLMGVVPTCGMFASRVSSEGAGGSRSGCCGRFKVPQDAFVIPDWNVCRHMALTLENVAAGYALFVACSFVLAHMERRSSYSLLCVLLIILIT